MNNEMSEENIFTQNIIFIGPLSLLEGLINLALDIRPDVCPRSSFRQSSVRPSICNAVFSGLAHNLFCMKLGLNNH